MLVKGHEQVGELWKLFLLSLISSSIAAFLLRMGIEADWICRRPLEASSPIPEALACYLSKVFFSFYHYFTPILSFILVYLAYKPMKLRSSLKYFMIVFVGCAAGWFVGRLESAYFVWRSTRGLETLILIIVQDLILTPLEFSFPCFSAVLLRLIRKYSSNSKPINLRLLLLSIPLGLIGRELYVLIFFGLTRVEVALDVRIPFLMLWPIPVYMIPFLASLLYPLVARERVVEPASILLSSIIGTYIGIYVGAALLESGLYINKLILTLVDPSHLRGTWYYTARFSFVIISGTSLAQLRRM